MLVFVITFDASSGWASQPNKCHFTLKLNFKTWEPTSQGPPQLQIQLQDVSRFTFSWHFSSPLRCTLLHFPSVSSRVSLLFLSYFHQTTTNVGAECRTRNALYFYELPWLKISKNTEKNISVIDCLNVVENVRIRTCELSVLNFFVADRRIVHNLKYLKESLFWTIVTIKINFSCKLWIGIRFLWFVW